MTFNIFSEPTVSSSFYRLSISFCLVWPASKKKKSDSADVYFSFCSLYIYIHIYIYILTIQGHEGGNKCIRWRIPRRTFSTLFFVIKLFEIWPIAWLILRITVFNLKIQFFYVIFFFFFFTSSSIGFVYEYLPISTLFYYTISVFQRQPGLHHFFFFLLFES